MYFQELAVYFDKIEKTPSRLIMTEILSDLFKKANEDEIAQILYILQGGIAPEYRGIELNIGEKLAIVAASRAVGIEKQTFLVRFKNIGDIGLVVEASKKQNPSFLENKKSVLQVFNELKKIAQATGTGSQEVKLSLLTGLLQELDPLSCRFIIRIPINKLRLGFSDMTILDAFSWMIKGDKSLRKDIQGAYHVRPDIGYIGYVLKKEGLNGIKHVKPEVFTPIIMMRAERLNNPEEILEKATGGYIEPKYDGFRLQIHMKKGEGIKLYTRSLEDVSHMYPDLTDAVTRDIKCESIIFEGEAVGYNPKTGQLLPFQETVTRKRKYDIAEKMLEIPLRLFAFDLLYLNGEEVIYNMLEERRSKLQKIISEPSKNSTIVIAPIKKIHESKDIVNSFNDAVKHNLEGVMIKKLDGLYQPGARNWNWIKYKKSYSDSVADTIDCLVMGYDVGQGKRTGFGIGALLIGVYDEKEDVFKSVSKMGTGLTDIEWKTIKKQCEPIKTSSKPDNYDVDKQMYSDIWVTPKVIVEIRVDEITRSPVHTAGRVMRATKSGGGTEVETPGFALRFPRLERMRDDKKPSDATTVSEVIKIFEIQSKNIII